MEKSKGWRGLICLAVFGGGILSTPAPAGAVFPADEKSGRAVLPESMPVIRRVERKRETVPRRMAPPPPRPADPEGPGLTRKMFVGSLLLLLLVAGYFFMANRREGIAPPSAGKPRE